MNKFSWFLIAVITITGFCLRLSGINYGLPSKNHALTTYHPDEPISFYTIEKWKPAQLYFHPGRTILWGGFHLVPMAAALKIAQIAGYVKFGSREFYINNLAESDKLYRVSRLVQVFCGAAAVFVLFLAAKEIFGAAAGILSAFFLAVSAVHMANSFLNRPDAMMVFLALLSLLFSLRVWEKANMKYSILSGIFLGLATVTKYSAAPYGIFPLLFHLLSPDRQNRKNLIVCLGCALIAVLAGSPYMILDFKWFYSQFILNIQMAKTTIVPVTTGNGFVSYASYFLPYGNGMPVVLCAIAGILLAAISIVRKKYTNITQSPKDNLILLFALCTIIVYAVISAPRSQQVLYTLPVVPLLLAFAAYFCIKVVSYSIGYKRLPALLFTAAVCAYTAIYSIAYLKLFTGKNTREEASEWIEKNIPPGDSIGIMRSYFWTPGVLRQYEPPYKIIAGGNDQSSIDDAALGMENVSKEAHYIVLSEFEYRTYLFPKFKNIYPRQAQILEDIMGKKYTEIARFNKEASFLGLSFPNKDFPPFDWLLPNPTIIIYKKNA